MTEGRSPRPPASQRARAAPVAALLAVLVAASGAAGCSLLDPVPDRTRWYTLPAPGARPGADAAPATPRPPATSPAAAPEPRPAPAPAAAASSGARRTFGLGPVTLPPYLDRPEVVLRASPERVSVSSLDRWAAPLPELFRRALAEELRARLPAWQLVEWPWPRTPPPDLAVAVDVLRFEADTAGSAWLEARWTVRVGDGAPATGETRVVESAPAGDVAASVAALGRSLEALARDLAAAAPRSLDR
jgi:hypothetical protein